MKFSTRYGIMLLCGWQPPTLETPAGEVDAAAPKPV